MTVMYIIIFCLCSLSVGLLYALAGTLRNLRVEEGRSARLVSALLRIRKALDLPVDAGPSS